MKKGLALTLILMLGLFVGACDLFPSSGFLTVVVTDLLTGEPLVGVTVEVGEEEGKTNESGALESIKLSTGLQTVRFMADDYLTLEKEVNIERNEELKLEVDMEWADGLASISGFVTQARGGNALEDVRVTGKGTTVAYTDADGFFTVDTWAEHMTDLYLEKEGMAAVRVQDVCVEEDGMLGYEIPMRKAFHPEWSAIPPRIEVTGLERGEIINGEVDITVTIDGDLDTFVFYVYLGGMQRQPVYDMEIGENELEVTLNTTLFPNGETYLRVLAYDDNENATLLVLPLEIENPVLHDDVPGAIPFLAAVSVTFGENFGYYSLEERTELFAERGLEGDPSLLEAPMGHSFDLESIPPGSTMFVELDWDPAPGATGYAVYRSQDGEDYTHIGNVPTLFYDDFSPVLTPDEKIYYKIVPYNSFGEGDPIYRWVEPLPPYEVNLLMPWNYATEVDLTPTFTWEHDVRGSFPADVMLYDSIWLWEATWSFVWYAFDMLDVDSVVLPGELEPGAVYTWDIFDSWAGRVVDETDDTYTLSYSYAGDLIGSTNGEFIFTTSTDTPAGPVYDDVDFRDDHILVRASDLNDLEPALAAFGSTVVREWPSIQWALVTVPAGADVLSFIKEVQTSDVVLFAEPDLLMELPNPRNDRDLTLLEDEGDDAIGAEDYDKLWGMPNINADKAWEMNTGCENVVVAIIDTGVQLDHPAFANNTLVAPFNATGDDGPGANDFHGHGTHVAGTAVNDGRDGRLAGVAWDTLIMPIRVMDLDGVIAGSYTISAYEHIMEYMDENPGKRVVTNYSIGGRGYSYALKDILDVAFQDYGILKVTSAGNDSKRVLSFPGAYNVALSVAASTPYDEKAGFSTTGFWNSVAAPGVRIWSAHINDGYTNMQGTSMASPHVAGAVGLLLSEYPDLTALEIRNQVEQTARPGAYGPGFTEELGYGILDVEALLGDLKPMQYGSLTVESDIVYGLITIFDADGNMVEFGATGANFDRYFPALKPGTYTVTLSYFYEMYGEATVEIGVGDDKVVTIMTGLVF